MTKELMKMSLQNRLKKLQEKPTETKNIEKKIIRQLRKLEREEA